MRPAFVTTAAEMRALDEGTIASGTLGLMLMENAGRHAAYIAQRMMHPDARVLIVAGPGNNGGDGYVVARILLRAGFSVRVALLAPLEKVRGDARTNLDAWLRLGGDVTR